MAGIRKPIEVAQAETLVAIWLREAPGDYAELERRIARYLKLAREEGAA